MLKAKKFSFTIVNAPLDNNIDESIKSFMEVEEVIEYPKRKLHSSMFLTMQGSQKVHNFCHYSSYGEF